MIWVAIVLFLICIISGLGKIIRDQKEELRQKQEFIDKYLFVVNFPYQHYVFPYVLDTKQKEVLYLLTDPRATKTLYEVVSKEEARRRIASEYYAYLGELDESGI